MASLPTDSKDLRACLLCSLVKTFDQFYEEGCDNCESILQCRDSKDTVLECSSTNFDGMSVIMKPEESWLARWQHIDKFKPGVYAITVQGELPEEVVQRLDQRGITYRPRSEPFRAG